MGNRLAMVPRSVVVAALAVLSGGCQPGLGPFVLPAVRGQVIDRDSGEAIAFAEVFEWYHGAGRMGGPQPVSHSRWTTADERGHFAFPREYAASWRLWFLAAYGPSFSFYAPAYGLQHGPEAGPDPLLLLGASANAQQAQAYATRVCRERDDPGARRLAEIACPKRPTRPLPN